MKFYGVSLFLENRETLLKHIENFESELNVLKLALKQGDRALLQELFIKSTNIRRKMEK